MCILGARSEQTMDKGRRDAKARIEQQELAIMQQEANGAADQANVQLFRAYCELLAANDGLSENQIRFLATYAGCGIMSRACIEAKVAPRTHYDWMTQQSYKEAFQDARVYADEKLESLAYDLANGRFSRPIASAGKVVAYEQIFDTKLLQTLLRARMPEKYAQKVDVTSNGHSIVKIVDRDAWESV